MLDCLDYILWITEAHKWFKPIRPLTLIVNLGLFCKHANTTEPVFTNIISKHVTFKPFVGFIGPHIIFSNKNLNISL